MAFVYDVGKILIKSCTPTVSQAQEDRSLAQQDLKRSYTPTFTQPISTSYSPATSSNSSMSNTRGMGQPDDLLVVLIASLILNLQSYRVL